MKKLTTEEWVEKARATHGDKYDYSESVYSGSKNKITIICQTHGKVKVIAANHINGNKSKCPKCSGNYVRTYEELIDDLVERDIQPGQIAVLNDNQIEININIGK